MIKTLKQLLPAAYGVPFLATGWSMTGWFSYVFVSMGLSLTVISVALMAVELLVRLGAKSPRYRNASLQDQKVEPPMVAEFLVGLCVNRRHRNSVLDNLEEVFDQDLAAGMSVRRARCRYWSATLNSIGPRLWALAKRIGIIGVIADYARRLLH